MTSKAIEIDIGGKIFKTTVSTLCSVDGFFSQLLKEESQWAESASVSPIFIDRDPHVFPLILSYLRSHQIFIDSATVEDLRRLIAEADFYQLADLHDAATAELALRNHLKSNKERFLMANQFDLNHYFLSGWAYVASLEGEAILTCPYISGIQTASWTNHRCSLCKRSMTWDEFISRHVTHHRPNKVILKQSMTREVEFKSMLPHEQNGSEISSEINDQHRDSDP